MNSDFRQNHINMDNKHCINPELIAPCGMNCAICSGYLGFKNQVPRKRGLITHCIGCRPRNKQCAFLKRKCKDNLKLLKGEVEYCFKCNCYPCERLKHLDERYRRDFGMSMIGNLSEIKQEGLDIFIERQYRKYKCRICNELISIHNKKCFICEKINSWKN